MVSPPIHLQTLSQQSFATNTSIPPANTTASGTAPGGFSVQSQNVPVQAQGSLLNNTPSSVSTVPTGLPATPTLSQNGPIQQQQNVSHHVTGSPQPSQLHGTSTQTSGTLNTSLSPEINASSPGASTTSLRTSITTPSPLPSISPPGAPQPQQTQATQPPQTPTHSPAANASAVSRTPRSILLYWLRPLIGFIVYVVTLGIAFSASKRYTLLGRVNGSWGTWFLIILGKGGDLAFAFAVADAFDSLAWGKLKKRQRRNGLESFSGTYLDRFLALVSSTGVVGLAIILARDIKNLWKERGISTAPGWGFGRSSRERWKRWRNARWGFARLMFVVVLIPGPGIILLANIEQKDIFLDIRSMSVSGGVAPYDPDLATVFRIPAGPDISRLAQMMHRDPSITWPVGAIDPACKATKTCKSYLIAGPYRTVQPWPFTVEDDILDGFRLHHAPFYQVDMWNPEPDWALSFNETKECNLYGGFNATNEYSMTICMKQHATDVLVAGWKSCQSGYAKATNQCLDPASLSGKQAWSTYLHFYRRTATVVFSRSLFTMLDVSELGPPQSQNISAASLFQSTNAMLYRPNQTSNDIRFDRKSQPYVLTQLIGLNLWMTLEKRMNGLFIGKDWLRNILTLPVYLFQPTAIATSDNVVPGDQAGRFELLNIPDENHVRGSYCTVHKRAIPGRGTVIGYACVAGLVLVFVGIAKWVAFRWPVIEPTEFPLLDFERLTLLVNDAGHEVSLRQRFDLSRNDLENGTLLDEMAGLRVALRRV